MPLACFIFAAAILRQDPPPSQAVTYESRGASVEQILQNLSESTDRKFRVSGPISDDVLIVRFAGAPLREVMAQIAFATTAHWEQDEDGYTLRRTAADLAPLRAEKKQAIKTRLQQQLSAGMQELRAAGALTLDKAYEHLKRKESEAYDVDFDEAYERRRIKEQYAYSASARFILRILNSIGADRIAELLANSGRIQFATDATPLQTPLTVDPGFIADFVREHNASIRASRELYPQEIGNDEEGIEWRSREEVIVGRPAKIILNVRRDFGALLSWYDDEGMMTVGGDLRRIHVGPAGAIRPPLLTSPTANQPLKLSPLAEQVREACEWNGETQNPKPLAEELASRFLNPDRFEPLSLFWGEALVETAKQEGMNLAVVLPDDRNMASTGQLEGPVTAVKILAAVRATISGSKERWILSRPPDPEAATAGRVPRKQLARLIQASHKSRRVTLDDCAEYAVATHHTETGASGIFAAVALQSFDVEPCFIQWHALKLYGSLTKPQRAMLAAGRRIPFPELTAQQRQWITSAALSGGLEPDDPPEPMPSQLALLPSQTLGYGLPANGWMDMEVSKTTSLECTFQGPSGEQEETTVEVGDLAIELYVKKHPEARPAPAEFPTGKIIPRITTRSTLSFHVAPGIRAATDLSDFVRHPERAFTLDNIPPDIAKEIEDYFRIFDELRKKGLPISRYQDDDIQGVPPPPKR